MSVSTQASAPAVKPAAQEPDKAAVDTAAAIQHEEPKLGGSYTRDLSTGALIKAGRNSSKTEQE